MSDPITICNLALGWVGADPIRSFDDRNTTAELCRNNYPLSRRAVLEDSAWTFAMRRMVLDTFLAPDDNRWGDFNAFPIPDENKVLNVQRVYPDPNEVYQSEGWQKEGSNILARDDIIYVRYTFDLEDTTEFTPGFIQALAARMAADLAIPIASSRTLQADMWQLYAAKLLTATSNDGAQGANERLPAGRLVRSRGGYGRLIGGGVRDI